MAFLMSKIFMTYPPTNIAVSVDSIRVKQEKRNEKV